MSIEIAVAGLIIHVIFAFASAKISSSTESIGVHIAAWIGCIVNIVAFFIAFFMLVVMLIFNS